MTAAIMTDVDRVPAPEAIGDLPWSRDALIALLDEFAAVYARRPIQNNYGGMSSAHLFALWSTLRLVKPSTVIESGVFQGQGTWLIEQAVPDATLHCIDINWTKLRYRSSKAEYHNVDFGKIDWSDINKEKALCFFDDHQNAFERLKLCSRLGFRHLMFEDNYFPAQQGDVYTLKQALAGIGYTPTRDLRYWASRLKGTRHDVRIAPNGDDALVIRDLVEVYQELPPIYLPTISRWGTSFDNLPTTAPLFTEVTHPAYQVFADEAEWYTWIAYVRLKQPVFQ